MLKQSEGKAIIPAEAAHSSPPSADCFRCFVPPAVADPSSPPSTMVLQVDHFMPLSRSWKGGVGIMAGCCVLMRSVLMEVALKVDGNGEW